MIVTAGLPVATGVPVCGCQEKIFPMKIAAMKNPSPAPDATGQYQPQGRVVGAIKKVVAPGHCGSEID